AWQRFFDFGTTTVATAGGEILPADNATTGYNGLEAIYVTPLAGTDAGNGRTANMASELRENNASVFVNAPLNQPFPTGSEHYFALVKNATANTLSLYMDGDIVGQAST